MRRETGSVLFEAAVITPVFLVMVFGGMALASMMRRYQTLSLLSREAANSALRECGEVASPTMMTPCLDTVLNEIRTFAEEAMPGAAVIITVYMRPVDATNHFIPELTDEGELNTAGAPYEIRREFDPENMYSSRYTPNNVRNGGVAGFNDLKPVIAVGEVFYGESIDIPFLGGLFDDLSYYETTIN